MQLKMLGLLIAVSALFVTVIFVSMRVFDSHERQIFVGYLSVFSLISMFASPLFIIVSSCKIISHILILDGTVPSPLYCFTIFYARIWWLRQGVLNSCRFIFPFQPS
jgi:hypothetical protein